MGLLSSLLASISNRRWPDLRTSIRYSAIGPPGPLITGLFAQLQGIRGSFNVDDCGHFHLVLSLQSAFGIRGDLLEIGSFHGRSTATMARYLTAEESLHACDAFRLIPFEHRRGSRPTPSELLANVRRVNPRVAEHQIKIYECLSANLALDPELRFRFIHVDGGHDREQALHDLNLSARHLMPRGIIAVDDYEHRACPGVAAAVDTFLKGRAELSVLADLNRHGARGRKVYLIKRAFDA